MSYKAPGKHYRKGISLIELFKKFPNNEVAEQWFEEQRWGKDNKHLHCPRCGSVKVSKVPSGKPMPYWCGDCRRNFSVRIGSLMERSKISYQKWVIAIFLWSTSLKGVSSMKLYRDLKITQKSAYFMAQRLREAWMNMGGKMSGPVEVDEAYFGGLEQNKHSSKKLKAGRGVVGKTAVVGVKDRNTNNISASVVNNTDKSSLQEFIGKHVDGNSTVYTDDYKSYEGMSFNHKTVKHSVGEFVNKQAHINGVESFWALLKRGYYGTFHHISPKHLHRYVNEFANRHNLRKYDTEKMMQEIYASMIGKRLKYEDLIA